MYMVETSINNVKAMRPKINIIIITKSSYNLKFCNFARL